MPSILFQLDEHQPNAIAEGLRRRGIDVLTAAEAGLRGASDEQYLVSSLVTRRVVVTSDDDFLRLQNRGAHHAGIAYYRHGTRTISQVIRALMRVYEAMAEDDLTDRVTYL